MIDSEFCCFDSFAEWNPWLLPVSVDLACSLLVSLTGHRGPEYYNTAERDQAGPVLTDMSLLMLRSPLHTMGLCVCVRERERLVVCA